MTKTEHDTKDIVKVIGTILLGGVLAMAVCCALLFCAAAAISIGWLKESGKPGTDRGTAGFGCFLSPAADHGSAGLSGHEPGAERRSCALRERLRRNCNGTDQRPAEKEKA